MPALREALGEAGLEGVRTHLQSGNIVLTIKAAPKTVARQVGTVIAEEFGLEIAVVTRTAKELSAVVRRNPLKDVADNPKRYQVSFLSDELGADVLQKLTELASESERFVAAGRELYAWHPEGVARSKLWNRLAGTGLGVTATARNWTTVTTLNDMANEA